MKILLLLLTFFVLANAKTPYTLTHYKSVYPVVEIFTKRVPVSYKQKIMKIMKTYTKELKINTEGYSDRALGIIVTRVAIADLFVLKVELLVGEDVKRLDDDEETFALTYQKVDIFEVEDLDEDLTDSVEYLLDEFKEQYIEDNEE